MAAPQDITLCFPTLVLHRKLATAEALNQALRAHCLTARERSLGVQFSNYGGWQSEPTLFASREPCVLALKEAVHEALYEITAAQFGDTAPFAFADTLIGWININDAGAYNAQHSHFTATWSGVYYVDPGEPTADRPESGALEFADPRGVAVRALSPPFSHLVGATVTPEAGKLIIFPGYLEHAVHPYFGKTPRISIAFNTLVHATHSATAAAVPA